MPSFHPSSTPAPEPEEQLPMPASRRLVVAVPAVVEPGDASTLSRDLARALGAGAVDAVVCHAESAGRGTLATVELLARLALLSRRGGCRLQVAHASPELRALVRFVGLEDALRCEDDLGVERER